jgi:DnaJ-class molecular chaperone
MHKVECPQCGGYGFIPLEEDGGVVQHACYHCCTEGYFLMDEEQYCDYVNELIDEAVDLNPEA